VCHKHVSVNFFSFLAQAVSEHGAAATFFVTLCIPRCSESLDCLTLAYFGLINVFSVTVDARRLKLKYFYRGRSQNWKTWKFRILTPMRPRAGISTSEIHFIISTVVSAVGQMPQKCPCRNTNPLAQTVYPLLGGKWIQILNTKKKFFGKKIFFTTIKIRWIHWWNPFLNPLTIHGDICNFVTAMSGLSNTSQCSIYN